MEGLKQWDGKNLSKEIIGVVLAALMIGILVFVAVDVRGKTEERCAVKLKKAVASAVENTAKTTIGQPAEIDTVYQTGDIVYCLANTEVADRAMGLCYRLTEAPTMARFVMSINDTDGEVGFSFEADELYLVKNDGEGLYLEKWAPPEGYIEKLAKH